MKKKYYYLVAVALAFIVFLVYEAAMFSLDSDQKYLIETQSATYKTDVSKEETQQVQSQTVAAARTSDTYYLVLTEGRVCIYRGENHIFYDYAEINLDLLPEEVQEQLKYGLYLSNEQELYDFLQSYSS